MTCRDRYPYKVAFLHMVRLPHTIRRLFYMVLLACILKQSHFVNIHTYICRIYAGNFFQTFLIFTTLHRNLVLRFPIFFRLCVGFSSKKAECFRNLISPNLTLLDPQGGGFFLPMEKGFYQKLSNSIEKFRISNITKTNQILKSLLNFILEAHR